MKQESFLANNKYILCEGAIIEYLRRGNKVTLHPYLENSLLIYNETGRAELTKLYNSYISVARQAAIPIIIETPTWRANQERLGKAGIANPVNKDTVEFMKQLRQSWGGYSNSIIISGLIGCKNDCYKPEEGLETQKAFDFHLWQIEQLASENVDFILAETLPALPEATGIALAASRTGLPYVISFVINRNGNLLDNTPLEVAIKNIDARCKNPPLGYMISCSHPSFLKPENLNTDCLPRLIGINANASALDHATLDGATELHTDNIEDWGKLMIELNRKYGIKILGGCCGTDARYLQYIVNNY